MAWCLVQVEAASCSTDEGRTFALAVAGCAAGRSSCMVDFVVVMVGQVGARMGDGAVVTAACQSVAAVLSEELDAVLEGVADQTAAGRMRGRPDAVGSLGRGAAEDEAVAQIAAADIVCLEAGDPAAIAPGSAGELAPASAGSSFVVVGLCCLGLVHAVGRFRAMGLARFGG